MAPRSSRWGMSTCLSEDDAVCPFFHRPSVWPHTHHVASCRAGGSEERRTLAFATTCVSIGACRGRLRALKRGLAARSGRVGSHGNALRGKSDFIGVWSPRRSPPDIHVCS